MKDTKYKILAYFDNQSYRKLFNEINSDYAENLQILLHNLSLFSYDVLIIGVILYKENISNIISAIRKITQIPIIILTDASSLLCMSWKKELIYAGADCVMDINSTIEEVDLQIFSLARRNNKQKITQKQSETMINKGKLVMDHKKHKVFWNNVALHLTRQEYNFLYLLAVTPMRVYTFEQIYQLVWKDYFESLGYISSQVYSAMKGKNIYQDSTARMQMESYEQVIRDIVYHPMIEYPLELPEAMVVYPKLCERHLSEQVRNAPQKVRIWNVSRTDIRRMMARGNAAIKKIQEQGAKAPEAVRSVRKGTVR